MDKFLTKRKASADLDEDGGETSSDVNAKKPKKSKHSKAKADYDALKRKRGFLTSWKNDYTWLENDENGGVMYCKWCRYILPSLTAQVLSSLEQGQGQRSQQCTERGASLRITIVDPIIKSTASGTLMKTPAKRLWKNT
jgi:hypothetical protein